MYIFYFSRDEVRFGLFRPRFLNSESPLTFGTGGRGGIGNIKKMTKKYKYHKMLLNGLVCVLNQVPKI